MSSAIIRNGHWRRRDPLAGLTPPMRKALLDAGLGQLELAHGAYSPAEGFFAHAPSTVRALAERSLLRLSAGAEGTARTFKLTREGRVCLAEIERRAAARVQILRDGRGAHT